MTKLDKEMLTELYITKNMTRNEIAELSGYKVGTIKKLLTKYQIKKDMSLRTANSKRMSFEKYGVTNAGGLDSSLEKARQTNLKRFGTEWGMQSNINKQKQKENNQKKYGVDNVFQLDNVKEKCKNTMLERYGVEHNTQAEGYKDKVKKAWENKDEATRKDIRDRTKKTMLAKYGVEYYSQTQAYRDLYSDLVFKNARNERIFETKRKNGSLSTSIFEQEVIRYINELGYTGKKMIKGKGDTRIEIDYLIKDLNLGIECNGCWWHSINSQRPKPKDYHFKKFDAAKELGIDLVYIWEDQWKNKQDQVKSLLRARLGSYDRVYEGVRSVGVLEEDEARVFCEENYIGRYEEGLVYLGLFINGELVSVMGLLIEDRVCRINVYCDRLYGYIKDELGSFIDYIGNNYDIERIVYCQSRDLFDAKVFYDLGFKMVDVRDSDPFFISRNVLDRDCDESVFVEGKRFECYDSGTLELEFRM